MTVANMMDNHFKSDVEINNNKRGDHFRLDKEFLQKYVGKSPAFGFNGLGEFTFYRTYSRVKEDGTKETPLDTFTRVVEGTFEIQRRHCEKHHISWSERKAQKSAQEMFERMWAFKFLPPGRGLWTMGTPFMWRSGSSCLNNCAFVSTKDIGTDLADPFIFTMDMSMVGVGVGFDTLGAGKAKIQSPIGEYKTYVIPDSREGWVKSLSILLTSYSSDKQHNPVYFDYSEIRPAGTPIKGFGGEAAGPGILEELHAKFRSYLDHIVYECDGTIGSVHITDMMDLIGKCVVAGNVRRTALLGLGNPNDYDYVSMKNTTEGLSEDDRNAVNAAIGVMFSHEANENNQMILGNHEFCESYFNGHSIVESDIFESVVNKINSVIGHRWASNNSISCQVGMNYEEVAKRTAVNGEPGYIWLDNMRNYGRMKDGFQKDIDGRVLGANPCLAGNMRLLTKEGYIAIQDLWESSGRHEYNGSDDAINKYGSIEIINNTGVVQASNVYRTGINRPTYRVSMEDGMYVDVTDNHTMIVVDKTKNKICERRIKMRDLKIGDRIPLNSSRSFGTFHDPVYAELAGWVIGDGSLHVASGGQQKATCSFYNDDIKDVAPRMRANLLELYQVHNKSTNQSPSYAGWTRNDGAFEHDEVQMHSCVLGRLLRNDGVAIGDKHHIPFSVWSGDARTVAAFIRGLASADGTVNASYNKKTISVRISQTNKNLLDDCKLLLNQFGINCAVYKRGEPRKSLLNDGKGGKKEYQSKQLYELVITGIKQVRKYLDEIGFIQKCKTEKAENFLSMHHGSNNSNTGRYVKVKSIEFIGNQDTYCLTEPENNRIVVEGYDLGNCVEQSLEDHELCTLVETFPANHDDADDFRRTLKFAYLYGKTVTLFPTHNRKTNSVMARNKRIGLSQSGIMQAIEKFGRHHYFTEFCDKGYNTVQAWDEIYSDWLCCRKSIKTTSVKPSGSVSLLADSTPGIHYSVAPSRHYWRRVRVASNSSLINLMLEAGYHIEKSFTDQETSIIKFGISRPDTKTVAESSMLEQLLNAVQMQYFWANNAVSATIQFNEEEGDQIAKALEMFDYQLKAISFLPVSKHGYAQAPYEAATKEEVEEYNKNLKPIDWSKYLNEDALGSKFCDGDNCEFQRT